MTSELLVQITSVKSGLDLISDSSETPRLRCPDTILTAWLITGKCQSQSSEGATRCTHLESWGPQHASESPVSRGRCHTAWCHLCLPALCHVNVRADPRRFRRLRYTTRRTVRWFAQLGDDQPSDDAFKFRRGEHMWQTRTDWPRCCRCGCSACRTDPQYRSVRVEWSLV